MFVNKLGKEDVKMVVPLPFVNGPVGLGHRLYGLRDL